MSVALSTPPAVPTGWGTRTYTHLHPGPREDGGGTAAAQLSARNTERGWQPPGARRGRKDLPLQPSEGARRCGHHDSRPLQGNGFVSFEATQCVGLCEGRSWTAVHTPPDLPYPVPPWPTLACSLLQTRPFQERRVAFTRPCVLGGAGGGPARSWCTVNVCSVEEGDVGCVAGGREGQGDSWSRPRGPREWPLPFLHAPSPPVLVLASRGQGAARGAMPGPAGPECPLLTSLSCACWLAGSGPLSGQQCSQL